MCLLSSDSRPRANHVESTWRSWTKYMEVGAFIVCMWSMCLWPGFSSSGLICFAHTVYHCKVTEASAILSRGYFEGVIPWHAIHSHSKSGYVLMEANQKALIWEWSKVEPRREQNLAMFGSKVFILGGPPVLSQNHAILTQKPTVKNKKNGHHSQGPRSEFHGKHAQCPAASETKPLTIAKSSWES